jgi:hypothetical protein
LIDGRLSIEHQLLIHIYDLFDVTSANNQHQPQVDTDPSPTTAPASPPPPPSNVAAHHIALVDVLAGIRYVMDYRIKVISLRCLFRFLLFYPW